MNDNIGQKNRQISRREAIAASVGLMTGLSGCASDSGGSGTEESGDMELNPDDPPEKPDSLLIRVWGGDFEELLSERVEPIFTEETGIDLEYDNTDRNVMRGNIRQAIKQDRSPPVNINWTVEVAAHEEFRLGLSEPLNPDIVTNIPEMLDAATPSLDSGEIPYLSLYSYTFSVNYNREVMEEITGSPEAPSSWEAFKQPEFENQLGVLDNAFGLWPVLSNLTDTPFDADDLQPIIDELDEFSSSIGTVGDDTTLTQATRNGEVAAHVAIMSNVVEPRRQDEPMDWAVPEEGAFASADTMYVPKNQSPSETYWSQKLINYCASADIQEKWMEDIELPMLNSNVEFRDFMMETPAYPTSESDYEKLITVDLDTYTKVISDLYEQFDVVIE